MKSELKKVTQEWMELERKTSKQRQVAELFYEENLINYSDLCSVVFPAFHRLFKGI